MPIRRLAPFCWHADDGCSLLRIGQIAELGAVESCSVGVVPHAVPPGSGRLGSAALRRCRRPVSSPAAPGRLRMRGRSGVLVGQSTLEMPGTRVSAYPAVKQAATPAVATSRNLISGASGTAAKATMTAGQHQRVDDVGGVGGACRLAEQRAVAGPPAPQPGGEPQCPADRDHAVQQRERHRGQVGAHHQRLVGSAGQDQGHHQRQQGGQPGRGHPAEPPGQHRRHLVQPPGFGAQHAQREQHRTLRPLTHPQVQQPAGVRRPHLPDGERADRDRRGRRGQGLSAHCSRGRLSTMLSCDKAMTHLPGSPSGSAGCDPRHRGERPDNGPASTSHNSRILRPEGLSSCGVGRSA
jgi:hypothetical protein